MSPGLCQCVKMSVRISTTSIKVTRALVYMWFYCNVSYRGCSLERVLASKYYTKPRTLITVGGDPNRDKREYELIKTQIKVKNNVSA